MPSKDRKKKEKKRQYRQQRQLQETCPEPLAQACASDTCPVLPSGNQARASELYNELAEPDSNSNSTYEPNSNLSNTKESNSDPSSTKEPSSDLNSTNEPNSELCSTNEPNNDLNSTSKNDLSKNENIDKCNHVASSQHQCYQSRKRSASVLQDSNNEHEFEEPGCSFWTENDTRKAKRQARNRRYYEKNKHQICQQWKASYSANKPSLLSHRKESYKRNRLSVLNKRKQGYTHNRPSVLNKRKQSYTQNRPLLLNKKKQSYTHNRTSVLNKRKQSYTHNRPSVLNKRKARYARNRSSVLHQRMESYTTNKLAILNRRKIHYKRNRALLLIKRSMNYIGNKRVILNRRRTDFQNAERRAKRVQQTAASRKSSKTDIYKVVMKFKTEIRREKPIYTCIICNRLFFRNQVVKFDKSKYNKCSLLSALPVGSYYNLPNGPVWICKTCHDNIKKHIVPRLSNANQLALCPQPLQLSELNILERHLIAPVIPFMKLVPLYKGCQKGIHGQVVCVKADVDSTAKALPRLTTDDSIIRVKLKRKLQYKNHVMFKQVCPTKIKAALNMLKEMNPVFEDIEINTDQLDAVRNDPIIAPEHPISESEHEETDNETNESDVRHEQDQSEKANEENTDGQDNDDITNTSVPLISFLQPVDFAQYVADHSDDSILSLAPAEGNRPINVLNVEAEAFPTQFPDGKNTYNEQRDPKVSPSRYFNARLFSSDTRFASDPQYIFFAQYATELNMITSQISIAMRQGHTKTPDGRAITSDILTDKEQVRQMIQRDTGFRFLRQIRGTPAYWDKTLKDLFAMIRQIGIPTWFVTFSAADRRWIEIDNAILEQQGKKPLTPEEHKDMDWQTHCENIYSNPVTAARMFDHRVKKFITDIIQSPAHPIGNVVDYFYRTEFQQRGWPHIHMLVWVEEAPDPYTESDETIVEFVDKYVSCELPSEDDDPELNEIVKSCQMHSKNHTKSCRKTGKTCRFNFPKPPSERTFIARTMNTYGNEDVNEDETDEISDEFHDEQGNIDETDEISDEFHDEQGDIDARNEAQESIKRVHDVLNDPDTEISENTTASEIFHAANVTQEEIEKALAMLSSRSNVYLKRKPADVLINNYNPHLIRAWNGNMDIQIVLDAYSCVKYILSYISKAERQMGDLLTNAQKEVREDNSDAITELRKVGNVYLHSRELSVMQSIYRVCSMHLKDCTRDVVFVQTDPDGQRISLPLSQLQNKDSTEQVWMTNMLDKYYGRPNMPKFNEMCLATFASQFRFSSSKTDRTSHDESDNEETANTSRKYNLEYLGRDLGTATERTGKPAIIRYPKIKLEKDPEKYYMNIIRMYLPHRDIELKPNGFESYASYYHDGSVRTLEGMKSVKEIVTENMKEYEPVNDKIDAAWNEMQNANENLENAWAALAPQAEQQRLDDLEEKSSLTNESDDDFDEIEIPELQPNTSKEHDSNSYRSPVETIRSVLSDDQVASMVRALNDKQLQLFKYVHQWCMKKVNGETPEPFRIFLTGGAGTGKSHVTRCIRYHAEKIFETFRESEDDRTVLVVAHTGTAAFNIEGETICSALNISIKSPRNYKPLGEESLNTMRTKFRHLQLLIIDEISMVSKKQLQYIHGRLQQIKRASDRALFGNVCVLAVGDFYQIPPINPSIPLCVPDDNPLNDLWTDNFKVCELTQIMRQQDDLEFAQLLNRLRVQKRNDTIDPADDEKLNSRTLGSGTDLTPPKEALHIFAFNKDVDSHNQAMLQSLPSETITIHALDMKEKAGQSQSRKVPYKSEQIGKTVLQSELCLAVGARVMLTTNLDVSDGLCNGVTGTVQAILPNDANNQPSAIYVKFDNTKSGANARQKSPLPNEYANCVVIKPHQESIEIQDKSGHQTRTRKQYPLKLAWAVTMHKVQGQTAEQAIISLKGTRACMAYVAISRVTHLTGLYLLNYDPKRIYCDDAVAQHLSNMVPCDLTVANQVLHTNHQQNFIIIHQNVQSLAKHYDDIKSDFEMRKAHVIALSETWLSTDHDKSQYELSGYELVAIAKPPEVARGRGIAMYVHESVNYTPLPLEVDECDILAIRTNDNPSMVIMTVYKPINTSISVLSNLLKNLCTQIEELDVDYIVILGDFNHDLLHKTPIDSLQKYHQLIATATTAKGTILDHIYIKPLPADYQASVLASHFSYHEPVFLSIKY